MAQFMSIYVNSKQGSGAQQRKPEDFIIKSFWKSEIEQDIDVIKKAFGFKK